MNTSDDLLTPKEVARKLRLSETTLRRLRYRGEGPAYVQVSDQIIRYRVNDVLKYIERRRKEASDERLQEGRDLVGAVPVQR